MVDEKSYGQSYYSRHKEKIRVKNHEYYVTHKEQLRPLARIRGRRYAIRHRNEINKRQREDYHADLERSRARERADARLWRQRHPEKVHDNNMKYNLPMRYGITKTDYEQMFQNQKGQCLLCDRVGVPLRVDHNHQTKVVRGLLCDRCNLGVDMIEKTEWFKQAIEYLRNPPARLLQQTTTQKSFDAKMKEK